MWASRTKLVPGAIYAALRSELDAGIGHWPVDGAGYQFAAVHFLRQFTGANYLHPYAGACAGAHLFNDLKEGEHDADIRQT